MRNLGIDLGWTIVGNRVTGDKYEVQSACFTTILRLTKYFDNVYIISKVNSTQKESSLKWIESVEFFNKTNIKPENLYYCFERKDKAIFAKGLGITHFIDDRAEVMYHLDKSIVKILFNPDPIHVEKYRGKLFNTTITNDWSQIPRLLNIGT